MRSGTCVYLHPKIHEKQWMNQPPLPQLRRPPGLLRGWPTPTTTKTTTTSITPTTITKSIEQRRKTSASIGAKRIRHRQKDSRKRSRRCASHIHPLTEMHTPKIKTKKSTPCQSGWVGGVVWLNCENRGRPGKRVCKQDILRAYFVLQRARW